MQLCDCCPSVGVLRRILARLRACSASRRTKASAPHTIGWLGCFISAGGIEQDTEAAINLVGAHMLEINDEWAVARRYMSPEGLARVIHIENVRLPAVVA